MGNKLNLIVLELNLIFFNTLGNIRLCPAFILVVGPSEIDWTFCRVMLAFKDLYELHRKWVIVLNTLSFLSFVRFSLFHIKHYENSQINTDYVAIWHFTKMLIYYFVRVTQHFKCIHHAQNWNISSINQHFENKTLDVPRWGFTLCPNFCEMHDGFTKPPI